MVDQMSDNLSRQFVLEEVYPLAERLFELESKRDVLTLEIDKCRKQLGEMKLDKPDGENFKFSEIGSVRIQASPPSFTKDTQANGFENLDSALRDELIGKGFLRREEKIVLNKMLMDNLHEEEIQKLVHQNVLNREEHFNPIKSAIEKGDKEYIETLIEKGIFENRGNSIRVQRQAKGKRSKRGRA
jgi:hypothetical protein